MERMDEVHELPVRHPGEPGGLPRVFRPGHRRTTDPVPAHLRNLEPIAAGLTVALEADDGSFDQAESSVVTELEALRHEKLHSVTDAHDGAARADDVLEGADQIEPVEGVHRIGERADAR